MPRVLRELHDRFAKVTHGPGNIYMWKPLLHLVPSLAHVERGLVLDLDLFVPPPHDLAALYREFDAFPPSAVIGVAREQQPTYDDNPHVAFGEGRNGGIQLLNLRRMRGASGGAAAAAYASALQRCANGACGDIGYLGDQTFYSAIANHTPALLHTLSCGWNRQLSFQGIGRYGEARFNATHACDDPCWRPKDKTWSMRMWARTVGPTTTAAGFHAHVAAPRANEYTI